MAGLLLFSTPSTGSQQGPKSKDIVTVSSALALQKSQWSAFAAIAGEAAAAANSLASGAFAELPLSKSSNDRAATFDAWQKLQKPARQWGEVTRPRLAALAAGIVAYANAVPDHYRKLDDLLNGASDAGSSAAEKAEAISLLSSLAAEAQAQAAQASALVQTFQPLLADIQTFLDAYAHAEVSGSRIRLEAGNGNLFLTVDDDKQTCVGNAEDKPERLVWRARRTGSSDERYTLANAAFPDLVLTVPDDLRTVESASFSPGGPRPKLGAAPVSPPRFPFQNDEFRLDSSAFSGGTIANLLYGKVLDCLGNRGWRRGTPVNLYNANGGANQRWTFETPVSSQVGFEHFDAMSTIAARDTWKLGIEDIEGEWHAIADDLEAGIAEVMQSIDVSDPFIAELSVQEVISAWQDVGSEAAAAAAVMT